MKAVGRRSILRDPAKLPFLAAAVAGIFLVQNFFPVLRKPARIWAGYYILQLKKGSAARGIDGRIEKILGAGRSCVSSAGAPVFFTRFDGLEESTVGEITKKLDEMDPRFDPYLKELHRYFEAGGENGTWELVYIPAIRSAIGLSIRLVANLGPPWECWRLVDFDIVKALGIALCAFSCVLLLYFSEKKRVRSMAVIGAAAVVLWLPLLSTAGVTSICAFFLLFFSWFSLLRECVFLAMKKEWKDRKSMWAAQGSLAERFFIYIIASAAVLFFISLLTDLSDAWLSTAVVNLVLWTGLLGIPFAFHSLGRPRARKRRRFSPIPIVRRVRRPPLRPAVIAMAVISAALAADLPGTYGSLPVPERSRGFHGLTWDSMGAGGGNAARGVALPGLAEAVTHAAFQDGLPFGRGYTPPARNEEVTTREFFWDPGKNTVVERQKSSLRFDDAWLEMVERRMGAGSVEGLLLSQGNPRVFMADLSMHGLRELPPACAILVALAATLFGVGRGGPLILGVIWRFNDGSRRYGMKSSGRRTRRRA